MDDFDLEVIDLRTGVVVHRGLEADDREPPDIPEPPGAETPRAGSGRSNPSTHAKRRRIIGGLAAGAAVLLALVVALASLPDPAGTVGALLHVPTPTSTAALANGSGTFLAKNTVPWGNLQVDGKPLSLLDPQTGYFVLPRGRHTLLYRADPFPPLRCVVSVPAAPTDSCPLVTSGDTRTFAPLSSALRVLDLGDAPTRLPPQQQAALIEAIQMALDARGGSTQVRPGELYAGPNGTPVAVTEPLTATFSFMINTNPNDTQLFNGEQCVTFCAGVPAPSAGGRPWTLVVRVVAGWHFVTLAGQPVASHASTTPATPVQVAAAWEGHWIVTLQDNLVQSVCQDAPTMLLFPGHSSTSAFDISETIGPHPADGCLLDIRALDSTGIASGKLALVLYRFGVLLAASPLAHLEFPALPVADAQEQALTRQISSGQAAP